jgi:hypothetical protein
MSDAADQINAIITSALEVATSNTNAAVDAANDLISTNAGVYITPPDSLSGFAVEAVEPAIPTVNDSKTEYDVRLAEIIAMLADQLGDFFTLYYPLASDAFDEATAWLVDTITNGGTGINADIENQAWQRDRDRIIADGRRVEKQIYTGFAAKGIMMPAGAMLAKVDEARFVGLGETGKASTAKAVEQLRIEIETVRFAVEQALKSRFEAMRAAVDYIRAMATAPASAVDVTNVNSDAQAKMVSAYANLYNVRLERDRIILNSKLAELESRDGIYIHRRTNATQNSQVEVQALTAAADTLARTAAAFAASLNSVASTSVNAFA